MSFLRLGVHSGKNKFSPKAIIFNNFSCTKRDSLASGSGKTIGRLAQLVERLLYTEDVGSSSLSSPTSPILFS